MQRTGSNNVPIVPYCAVPHGVSVMPQLFVNGRAELKYKRDIGKR